MVPAATGDGDKMLAECSMISSVLSSVLSSVPSFETSPKAPEATDVVLVVTTLSVVRSFETSPRAPRRIDVVLLGVTLLYASVTMGNGELWAAFMSVIVPQ